MTAPYDTGIVPARSAPPPFDVARVYPQRELGKGDRLYRAGDPADTIYRVEEGLLKLSIDVLTGKERIVSLVGPGDLVGALTPTHRLFQETAEALSPRVVVRVVPSDGAREALQDEIMNATGLQISRLREALEDGELPVTARLARTLLRLGRRFGHIAEDERVRLTLPLTHENFAAMIGAARETTTAILGEMRSSGVIEGTRGRYSFDRDSLYDYAVEAALP